MSEPVPSLVPSGFVVPTVLVADDFRLEPLGPQHNDSDYEAWSSSLEHIHATPGWEESRWPREMTLEEMELEWQRAKDAGSEHPAD